MSVCGWEKPPVYSPYKGHDQHDLSPMGVAGPGFTGQCKAPHRLHVRNGRSMFPVWRHFKIHRLRDNINIAGRANLSFACAALGGIEKTVVGLASRRGIPVFHKCLQALRNRRGNAICAYQWCALSNTLPG